MIHRLLSEEEMRYVHTVAIVLNCRKESKLYKDIYDTTPGASEYLKSQEAKAEPRGDEEEEAAQKKEGSKKKKSANIASAKENSMKETEDPKYPFKSKFL